MTDRKYGKISEIRPAKHNLDYVLLAVVIFLVSFGLLMIYSASSYEAGLDHGDSAYYLKKQAVATAIGFVALLFFSKLDYRLLQRLDYTALIVSVVLILLLLTPLGITKNGATRWLNLHIGLNLQPAEVAKLGIIIYTASIIQRMEKINKNVLTTKKGLLMVFVPTIVVAGLIYVISKNMSSAIIVVGIAVAMYFVAIPNYKIFVIMAAAAVAAVFGIVYVAKQGIGTDGSFRLARIQAWLDPESFSTDKAFQTLQALYAIGSGGIWGKGLGQSMQKRRFLPEAQNDMIFSIICEELGLFGAMIVIMLFVVLIWNCMIIANRTVDRFGSLLVVGVMAHYAIQVILNIAVVTNTIPNTGITLPFISYGGSASLFLLSEIGIVLNVSKHCR